MKFNHRQGFSLFAAATLILLTPLSASAHDEVVGTSPTADSTVHSGLINVSVTFNEDIMKNPDLSGEVVELVDQVNDVVTLTGGCLTVEGATLAAKVRITQAGTYTVNWRSVSNDGHPNEGSFKFNVDQPDLTSHEAVQPAGDGACAATYSAIDTASGDVATATPLIAPAPAVTGSATKSDPFITNLPYLGFGILLIVLGALAGPAVQKLRQKRASAKAAYLDELKKIEQEEQ